VKVISNTAISLDGRINTREGVFTTLGTARDHRRMSWLRSQSDAVLIGGATFRNWPHPSLPDGSDLEALDRPLWNIVVTRTLDLPLSGAFLAESRIRRLILTCEAAPALPPEVDCEVERAPGEHLSIDWILRQVERGASAPCWSRRAVSSSFRFWPPTRSTRCT
jgi:riboflavin biosynthesis pyrimidine reductase